MAEPWELDVVGARRALELDEFSAMELLTSCLKRIDAFDHAVNAFEYLDPALAAEDRTPDWYEPIA